MAWREATTGELTNWQAGDLDGDRYRETKDGLMVRERDDLDDMTWQYVESALWSSYDTMDPSDSPESLDVLGFTPDDLAPEAARDMRADLGDFLDLLEDQGIDWESQWSPEQLAHDFWLTRNRHGAGFWDRGLPLGDVLTKWARSFGSVDLYVGDDGLIHLA